MFYVKNEFVSTLQTPEYIYCKKLVKNLDGQRRWLQRRLMFIIMVH